MDWSTGVRFPAKAKKGLFLFATVSIPALGPTQPPIQWVPRGLNPEIMRQVREADHSSTSSAEVGIRGAILPLPLTSAPYLYSIPIDGSIRMVDLQWVGL
jgi:hypothetical protein